MGLRRDYGPLLRSASWNYLGYFFDAAVSLALVAYVVRWVGVAEYGVYLFALSLAGQFGLLNFGLPNLLSQAYIAERSRTGAVGVSRLLSSAFTFSALLGMAALGICLGCAALLPGPFRIPPGLVPLAKQALALGGVWMFLAIPSKSLDLVVESWHRFDTLNKLQILLASIRAVATVALLRGGLGILALMWIQVALAGLRLVLLVLLIPGQTRGVRVNPFLWDWPLLRPVLRSAGWASLDDVVWQLGMGMDTLIVSVLVSMRGVAIYGVGSKAAVHLISLVRRGLNVVFPALAERHTAEDSESLRSLYVTSCRAALTVLFPITLALMVFADTIVQVWVGPQYQGAATVMRWLLVGAFIEGLAAPANYLLYACGRVATAARIGLAENALNFGLSCLLVFPFGAAGPAMGTAIAHTLGTIGGFVRAACRIAQLAPRRLVSLLIRDNGVPALISFVGLSLAWYFSGGSDPWLRLVIGALIGPPLYFAARLTRMESVPWKHQLRAALRRVGFLRSAWQCLCALKDALRDSSTLSRPEPNREFERSVDPYNYTTNPLERQRHCREAEMLDAVRGDRKFENALEVGCAEGIFTEMLAERCDALLAADISPLALERARARRAWDERVSFTEWDLRTDPLPCAFDLIVVVHALEYFRNPLALRRVRAKLVAGLRPQGYLLVGSTSEHDSVASHAWWGRYLVRGGKRITEFIGRHPALKVVDRTESPLPRSVSYDVLFQKVMRAS